MCAIGTIHVKPRIGCTSRGHSALATDRLREAEIRIVIDAAVLRVLAHSTSVMRIVAAVGDFDLSRPLSSERLEQGVTKGSFVPHRAKPVPDGYARQLKP